MRPGRPAPPGKLGTSGFYLSSSPWVRDPLADQERLRLGDGRLGGFHRLVGRAALGDLLPVGRLQDEARRRVEDLVPARVLAVDAHRLDAGDRVEPPRVDLRPEQGLAGL